MADVDEKALEAAANAVGSLRAAKRLAYGPDADEETRSSDLARAAITAYLAALPQKTCRQMADVRTNAELAAMLREAAESGMAKCYDDDFLAAADRLASLPPEDAQALRDRVRDLLDALDELHAHGIIPCSDKLAKAYANGRAALPEPGK